MENTSIFALKLTISTERNFYLAYLFSASFIFDGSFTAVNFHFGFQFALTEVQRSKVSGRRNDKYLYFLDYAPTLE